MTPAPSGKRDRSLVRERRADELWLVLIVAMSVTVLGVRFFLELTGYPRIGGGDIHIAHVLWGGLALFVAVVLPLSIANGYVLWGSALLGGIGAGLFVDEIGKLFTSNNDYFVPLALPVVYAFILVCVWLYYRLRRHSPETTRALLYHALADLQQVLDGDLDPFEYRELVAELEEVLATSERPSERRLAADLLDFARSRDVDLVLRGDPLERALRSVRARLARWPSRRILTLALIVGFSVVGVQSVTKIVVLQAAAGGAVPLLQALGQWVVLNGTSEYVLHHPTLLLATTLAVVVIGLLALLAAGLLVVGRERPALRIGVLALVISLSIVNLFTFYFSQLAAVVDALVQVAVLALAALYRWRFLPSLAGRPKPPGDRSAPGRPEEASAAKPGRPVASTGRDGPRHP